LSSEDGLEMSLKTSGIEGRRRKEKVAEDDVSSRAPILMLPSMCKQTPALEAVDTMTSDRTYSFKHRQPQHKDSGDKAQSAIRRQRAASMQRSRFGNDADVIGVVSICGNALARPLLT
jgi:hypothetical protein